MLALVIIANNLALLAGPYLVKYGIDSGIPPLLKTGSGSMRPLVPTERD